ncbi:hypothetical protein SISNIDRAFT_424253 [Sistotremastrum niveocremeum HHB9708]|uniref:Fatty acid desaturase domain-containing protein n=1 Tax=Sistotremastrum niveocremeum HHB9708 TaxID=1314777 RepID=A0A164Y855_9AGAM|nr:hypothetical protein SISNIDRAFT_424253 [Sistotremastrum niveocremeum HHB9708]
MSLFKDSPEYLARKQKPFRPPNLTLKDIHDAIPKDLYKKNTLLSLGYIARDVFFSALFWHLANYIEPISDALAGQGALIQQTVRWGLWANYWFWQSVAWGGFWCLAHEAGHGTLSSSSWFNHISGFMLHTVILVPYYAWRSTHHAHHKATGSIERDENFVPRTRVDYHLPAEDSATHADYKEMFEETPIFTLGRMVFMQLLGWQAYLLYNALGSPMYPEGTNHFEPSSALFKPEQRFSIIISNIGLSAMSGVLAYYTYQFGLLNFFCKYFVPYLLANHWIVMLTFLHHTDPTMPHYRKNEWSFLRGAVGTIDRPLLGWIGRFFLHNVSHDHVAHHFLSMIPFYNQPIVTEHVKKVLGEDYNYDNTNTFRALYRSFTECCFIEEEGDIVFYKNRKGELGRELAADAYKVGAERPKAGSVDSSS